ncbi:MAG: nuclear transport factor 2 family protein [Gammaproteobacteria bacterium]|nr:nuclear transport factor 2 family protein [Gammaproteobacteria bacterium]
MDIVKHPITGQEPKLSTSSPYSALVDFYRSFNNQNYELMKSNWSLSDEISMSNPLGGIKRGWNEIEEVYKKIFNGPAKVYVEFYEYSIYTSETMFLAAGRERGTLEINNEIINLAIRTSRAYCLQENQWKQIHHHGSMDNPELLAIYQKALRNNKLEI